LITEKLVGTIKEGYLKIPYYYFLSLVIPFPTVQKKKKGLAEFYIKHKGKYSPRFIYLMLFSLFSSYYTNLNSS